MLDLRSRGFKRVVYDEGFELELGDTHCNHSNGYSRDFSPAHYAEILQDRNVKAVIRLNSPEYEDKAFTDQGIAVADLRFGVCVPPPADVVGKFLAIAEGVSGPVAVHCRAGLGRTGTLIGLYMMKNHGFTAREAMGWLRIVRPGRYVDVRLSSIVPLT